MDLLPLVQPHIARRVSVTRNVPNVHRVVTDTDVMGNRRKSNYSFSIISLLITISFRILADIQRRAANLIVPRDRNHRHVTVRPRTTKIAKHHKPQLVNQQQ